MGKTRELPGFESVSTKQQRIAELAKQMPGRAIGALSCRMDFEWMRRAYRRTRKDGAPGIDGTTAEEYEQNLKENLKDLLDRAKSGERYWAPPVRRVYIPKENGKKRSIGIPTFEDKVLQRAVVMALEPLYEQDFLECSYGFRPGRSQHDALDALWKQAMGMRGGWLIEGDIESFYDSVDREKLQEVIRQRVGDGVLLRLIGKWLRAGVMEEGCVYHPETGMPQGGVISPLLSNIFLHEVLDTWFTKEVQPRLRGRAFLVRYADDFVMLFEREDDARRVLAVMPNRFSKHGLRLHPEKTRLVQFKRPRAEGGKTQRPETFDLLGFTHYWGRSRKGRWVVKLKTARSRFGRAQRSIAGWLRSHRHDPIKQQHEALVLKLRGHDAYYGVTGNYPALARLRNCVVRTWRRWLSTRSRHSRLSWKHMTKLLQRFPLPQPRVVHSALPRPAKP